MDKIRGPSLRVLGETTTYEYSYEPRLGRADIRRGKLHGSKRAVYNKD